MISLHDKIMNIGIIEPVMPDDAFGRTCYKEGHKDARHAAAELANEADEAISELLEALEELLEFVYNRGVGIPIPLADKVEGLITKAKGLDQ